MLTAYNKKNCGDSKSSSDYLDVVARSWPLPNVISDWSLLERGTIKTGPSLSSICMHVIFEIGKGMCKKLISTDLNTSPDTKSNQK